jgi:hypothetical protein
MGYLEMLVEVQPIRKKEAEPPCDETEIWDFRRVTLANGENWMEGTRLDKPGRKSWRCQNQERMRP